MPDFSDAVTEALILTLGRPALFVSKGEPVLKGSDIEKWKDLINNSLQNLSLSGNIKSVGRIETNNLPGYTWVGTGWLFAEDLIMTNRHVARLFTENNGTSFSFQSFLNRIVEPRIDFLAEYENKNAAEFTITECIFISDDKEADVAVFRVSFDNAANYRPLLIQNVTLREREDIAVIGYPAFDSRVSLVEDMERIYQKIYDVKRFAPGKITKVYTTEGMGQHDASTLGGNSGSVVLSLETGKVLGLHFAGLERVGNYFVSAPKLKSIINRLPKSSKKTFISTTVTSGLTDFFPEMVGRQCKLEPYNKVQVPSFKISGRMVTFASPDSTYAVTKRFFKSARESILIGIYDFSAEHMVTNILDAIERGVSVSLMLDIDSAKEQEVLNKLKKYGVECVPAPSCASKTVNYFASSHEKVIVIDNKWTFIQSGNYSNNSIPFNEGDGDASDGFKTGNRDMGIAIESAPLAKFFTSILRTDMQLELAGMAEESLDGVLPDAELLIEAPKRIPDPLFPSQIFNLDETVNIQPVLSPDNYMDVIPGFLATAKKSIKIEQQYIRVNQPMIQKLLSSIPKGIEVQIIVAPPIGKADKTMAEVATLQSDYGYNVRLLSKKHFVHCHNKLIIVDDSAVLVSSQNWSDFAVSKNREAGVIIYHKDITRYYSKIFDADWTMSDETVEESVPSIISPTLEAFASQPGKFVRIDACDIQEV
ncbi:MAG: phosphatidylserine/phosphatidylglycerophosphate/cardiolipin synthase [Segetibacter sp.]|nr:phosphatidylserine/phosphatidylglycerophosphate/cardiolipin synthase [Segetibacter sp.]